MELPFKLHKYHKKNTKAKWKRNGLIVTEEEFEAIYYMYIFATHCELCNKQFKTSKDRHMEHNNYTGEFRNIACNKCNQLKADRFNKNNTSGYKGISKKCDKNCKQGFIWQFSVNINGKRKTIKRCVDKEKLIKVADEWKKKNNYNT
jgi:hypothetical protein